EIGNEETEDNAGDQVEEKKHGSRVPLYLTGRVFIVDVPRIFPPAPGSEGAMAFFLWENRKSARGPRGWF
ncbi:MAG: hypothetical protein WAU64_01835, partial [Methanoregula sp.]|uniref:hypothetical protein n=1 Tax=Methanoregula sp. TaxID=2052170 RepID=UPI003BAF5E44